MESTIIRKISPQLRLILLILPFSLVKTTRNLTIVVLILPVPFSHIFKKIVCAFIYIPSLHLFCEVQPHYTSLQSEWHTSLGKQASGGLLWEIVLHLSGNRIYFSVSCNSELHLEECAIISLNKLWIHIYIKYATIDNRWDLAHALLVWKKTLENLSKKKQPLSLPPCDLSMQHPLPPNGLPMQDPLPPSGISMQHPLPHSGLSMQHPQLHSGLSMQHSQLHSGLSMQHPLPHSGLSM